MSLSRRAALGLIGAAALARPALAAIPAGANLTAAPEGFAVPPLPLLRADGRPATLADFRGHATVAMLWQEHCPGCRIELPKLDALAREMAGDGVAVAPLCLDEDFPRALRALRERGHAALNALQDIGRLTGAHLARGVFGLNGLVTPMSFILDRSGAVRAGAYGFVDWGDPSVRGYLRDLARA